MPIRDTDKFAGLMQYPGKGLLAGWKAVNPIVNDGEPVFELVALHQNRDGNLEKNNLSDQQYADLSEALEARTS